MDAMQSIYEQLGQEEGVRRIVDKFYDIMDTLPEVTTLRQMHPPNLDTSRDKLTWFLMGRFGGPNAFVERVGPPRLRARHMPFKIDLDAAEEWMRCMNQALEEEVIDASLRDQLRVFFAQVALHMRNR